MDSDRTILGPSTTSLSIVDGKGNRTEISKEIIAGREVGCDLLLEEGRCSRKHASLQPAPGGILVTDLGSSNGTFINGTRVEKGIAKAGDELAFDTARYKVEGLASVQAEVTTLAPPIVVAAKVTSDIEPIPAPPPPVASESKNDAQQKGAWWAPKDEGPEGTMLMSAGASAAPAAIEGTQVMAALSVAEPSLVGLSGSVKGQSFKLSGDRWKIGRDANECNIVLDDNGVSAFHAQIINEGATWKLINLMSSNGSFVNGQRVQTAYLNGGDRLQFGSTEFVFNLGGLNMASGGMADTGESVTVQRQGTPAWVFAVIGFAVVAALGAIALFMK